MCWLCGSLLRILLSISGLKVCRLCLRRLWMLCLMVLFSGVCFVIGL